MELVGGGAAGLTTSSGRGRYDEGAAVMAKYLGSAPKRRWARADKRTQMPMSVCLGRSKVRVMRAFRHEQGGFVVD